MKPFARAVLASAVLIALGSTDAAHAQTKPTAGDAAAGRTFALRACTGCHVVAPDQPFKPVYHGPPDPPAFNTIASRHDVTAASLQHHLDTLPAVPRQPGMPNLMLSRAELQDLAAFIIGLRDQPASKQ
jgi:mono/diheme cytochrome c family protein